jgi:negative regulator of replication initiation
MTAKKQMAVDEDIHGWLTAQKLCKGESLSEVLRRLLKEKMERKP